MLFYTTRQSNFVISVVSVFFFFAIITAFGCIFMSAPSDRAAHHHRQAQLLERSYQSLAYIDHVKPDLLRLSERELLQSAYLDPYNVAVWTDLADVAQRNQKMAMANQALRFSHQFSDGRVIKDLPNIITVALNAVNNRYE